MTNKKITDFTRLENITGNEYLPIAQEFNNWKIDINQIKTFLGDQLLNGVVKKEDLATPSTIPAYGFGASQSQVIFDNNLVLENVAALRGYASRAQNVRLALYGVGAYIWDATDTTSADTGFRVIVDSLGRRWKRVTKIEVDVSTFGAKDDWDGTSGSDNTTAFQGAIDWVGQAGGGVVTYSGYNALTFLVVTYPNVRIVQKNDGAIVSLQPFTNTTGNPHRPTIWLARSNCAVIDVNFVYAGWVSANLASLLTPHAFTNPYYGCHVAVGWTALYNPAGSGTPSVVFGVSTELVYNTEITNVKILGAACHGIAVFNAVSTRIKNVRVHQYKGTGIFGTSVPGMDVSGADILTGGDDGIYFGTVTAASYSGGATPLAVSDMKSVSITRSKIRKTGAKGIGVAGYAGVIVSDNLVDETRVGALYFANEVVNAPKTTELLAFGNSVRGVFGSFGPPSDGYVYTTNAVAAVLGVYHAVDLSLCDGINIVGNSISLSDKITDANQKQYLRLGFGNGNFTSAVINSNRFSSFIRGNIGNETDTGSAYTTDVHFNANIVDALNNAEPAKLITVGAGATSVQIDGNSFRTLSPANGAAWAVIFPLPGSKTILAKNSFNIPNGLPAYANTTPTQTLLMSDTPIYDVAPAATILGLSVSGRVFYAGAVPSVGTWARGDIVFNNAPLSGSITYWQCVTAGTPGTWVAKQIGVVASIGGTPQGLGFFAVSGGIGYMSVGTSSSADWKQITN